MIENIDPEKIEQGKKSIEEIKKQYTWMDMRDEQEKERETEDLAWDLCVQQDLETDYTHDPNATKLSDFSPAARGELEQGIANHAVNLTKIKQAFDYLNMGPPKTAEDYIDTNKKILPDTGEMEYEDEWRKKLIKYREEGLTAEEAHLRILREERTGKERVGNEQYRDDIKLGKIEKDIADLENLVDNDPREELSMTVEELRDTLKELNVRLDMDFDDFIQEERNKKIRKERDTRIIQSIADFEEEKNKSLTDAEFNKVYNHLKGIWNKQHNFYE